MKGLTPLHLAVTSSENFMTTRSIRALIMKGASTKIPDKKGFLPYEYLNEFQQSDHNPSIYQFK
jgi:hypothetical protein